MVFTGGREGYFVALNARTGAPLWKSSVGGVVASGPMTYSVGGRRYVAVAAAVHSLRSPYASSATHACSRPTSATGGRSTCGLPQGIGRRICALRFADRLADVAIVVHHLRDAEVGSQQLRAVPRGSGADRVTREGCRRRLQPQGLG